MNYILGTLDTNIMDLEFRDMRGVFGVGYKTASGMVGKSICRKYSSEKIQNWFELAAYVEDFNRQSIAYLKKDTVVGKLAVHTEYLFEPEHIYFFTCPCNQPYECIGSLDLYKHNPCHRDL